MYCMHLIYINIFHLSLCITLTSFKDIKTKGGFSNTYPLPPQPSLLSISR